MVLQGNRVHLRWIKSVRMHVSPCECECEGEGEDEDEDEVVGHPAPLG